MSTKGEQKRKDMRTQEGDLTTVLSVLVKYAELCRLCQKKSGRSTGVEGDGELHGK